MLKTVEVLQLQFVVVGLGMHRIETVQKTVEVPQLPSRWVVQFLDKVVDMPVVVQRVDKVIDVPVVQMPQFIDGMDVPVIMQRRWVSRTVPQIQSIARVCRHSSSAQRRVPTVQTAQLSGGWWRWRVFFLAFFPHFSRSSGLSRS